MARPLRLQFAGALYHVTSRGDGRGDIFFCDADRHAWLGVLAQTCERFNWRVHAWCQMTNHYHVLLETPEGNLSEGMRHLNGVYTQHVNRRHHRVGHVFQGRFKAVLVEREAHLLELARYVVLNPVRAGMVNNAAEWAWSSHHAMLGLTVPPAWLEVDALLRAFARTRARAVAAYVDFVRAGVGLPPVWEGLRGQVYLGSDAFVEQMQALVQDARQLKEVPRLQRRSPAKPLSAYEAAYPRDEAMAMAYRSGDHSMRVIAEHFNVHYVTVSRAIRRAEQSAGT
ncbi:MAG: transposase [Planctomycetes bacterium]|nr:transposase [Planctomycetota bacterium]